MPYTASMSACFTTSSWREADPANALSIESNGGVIPGTMNIDTPPVVASPAPSASSSSSVGLRLKPSNTGTCVPTILPMWKPRQEKSVVPLSAAATFTRCVPTRLRSRW